MRQVVRGGNRGAGVRAGTPSVNAVSGVATFSTLSINNAGNGYTLTASASGLTGATSASFNKIGRASCRERAEISVVAVSLKKKSKTTAGATGGASDKRARES